jgi:lipoate-protein ligase A
VEEVTCRLLPYAAADGPHNMAADEALLESAAGGTASLRLYGWSEPTVSLGYFQPERVRHNDPAVARLPFVRRPSGGAALVHHHEVTYALALPAGPPWQTEESWLCRMHTILAGALASLGVTAGACAPAEKGRFDGLLCFQHLTPGDLLIGPAKVAGSAQRRQRGALLQHGAVLLAASPHARVLPGILELSGQRLAAAEVCAAVVGEFARATGWRLNAGTWTARERQRIEELAEGKYRQEAWNRKR